MNPLIDNFVSSKRIAVVGMSRSSKKFGNMASKELLARGYDIFPIHPEIQEIDGLTCYPNLKSLNGKVDGVWISIPYAPPVRSVHKFHRTIKSIFGGL
jgi:predicted CoA-binding protein